MAEPPLSELGSSDGPRAIEALAARVPEADHVVVGCVAARQDLGSRPIGLTMAERVAVARLRLRPRGPVDVEVLDSGAVVCVHHDADEAACQERFDAFADELWATGPFVLGYAERRAGEPAAQVIERAVALQLERFRGPA